MNLRSSHVRLALALLALITTSCTAATFYAPWPGGQTRTCNQGNNGSYSHTGNLAYAWDFSGNGLPVCASAPGTIVTALQTGYNSGWGTTMVIDHGDGTFTRYAHMVANSLTKTSGWVNQGETIGTVGATGNVTGPHLHFQVQNSASGASVPASFADIGVPTYPNSYTSQNYTDTTAPSISWGGQPTGRWYNDSGIQVATWSLSDGQSGVKGFGQAWDGDPGFQFNSSTGWLSLSGVGEGQHTVNVHAWDNMNNNSNNTRGWYGWDTTAPSVAITSGPSANTWYRSTQRVYWHVSDNLSGVRGFGQAWDANPPFQYASADGYLDVPEGVHTLNVHAWDNTNNARGDAGNNSNYTFGPYKVDSIAPVVSLIGPATSTWFNTPQSVTWDATDATSGIASKSLTWCGDVVVTVSPAPIPEGKCSATVAATDVAGNSAAQSFGPFWIDITAPVVTVVVSPSSSNGENGWYTVQPTIAVSAVDPNGSDGSGVSSRFYSIDGSEQPYTSEVTIPLGAHAVTGRAADVAGNSATVPVEIDVDTTAPVFVSVDTTETSGSLDTLTASWEFADPESDIAEYEYSIYREAGETDEFVAGPFVTDQPHAYQTNLSLTRGETYYFIVRAKNYAGTYSVYVPSDGILATEETRDVAPEMNSGGVSAEPRTSENYLVLDSFGQFVVDTSTSASFTLESGYWHSELTTTPVETIAIAKATENNKLVQLGSAAKPVVVTVAPGVFADRFYVEQPDRSSGIAVSFGAGLTSSLIPGDRVWILGTLNESGGERIIEYAAAGFVLHSDPLGALFVTNGWLGGSDLNSLTKGVEGAAGLNNIGLLVKTCGQVKQVDPSGAYFYISDGSSITDGTLTNGEANVGVRVAADGRSYTGQFVTVTGISSCFVDEGGKSQRLIRPVTITPLQ